MKQTIIFIAKGGVSIAVLISLFTWIILIIRGSRFALRDRLKKADAVVVLAGTRGNLKYLNGKIKTAATLYQQNWADTLIVSGRFSIDTDHPQKTIPIAELQEAAKQGRIQSSDIERAAKTWDVSLGASYMFDQAIQWNVPPEHIIIEDQSLHTQENALYVANILNTRNMKRIILVTSPFHQLRSYLTFAKVMQPYGIEILNYYADTDEWNMLTWFLSKEHRQLVKSERERIKKYRAKGDIK